MILRCYIYAIFTILGLASGRFVVAQDLGKIPVNSSSTFIDLNSHVLILTDSTSSASISEILAIQDDKWTNQRLSGRSSSDTWVKFRFENNETQSFDKILYINNLYLLEVDVFAFNDSLLLKNSTQTGLARSNETKPYQDPMYPITVNFPAQSTVTVLVKISDPITAIHNDVFFLLDNKEALSLSAKRLLYSNLWLGILLTAVIISIFLYLSIRRAIFIYYVLLGISTALVIGTNVGFVSLILDRDPNQYVGNLYQIGAATMMVFMPRFLNCIIPLSNVHSLSWRISCWIGYSGIVFAAAYYLPFVKYHDKIGPLVISGLTLVSAIVFLYLLVILGVCAFKRLKRARTLFLIYAVYLSMALGIVILPHLGMDTKEINSFLFLIGASIFEIVAFLLLMAQVTLDIYREREVLSLHVQNNQKVMVQTIVQSQEDERMRFSADLHDGLGQMITVLGMKIDNIQNSSNSQREDLFDVSRTILNDMYAELKNICFNLMPHSLIRGGVGEALKEIAPRLSSSDQLRVNIYLHDMESRLAQAQEISIFRIAQEWLNNVIKYANASQIDINLTKDDTEITLMIEDDGKGFDTILLTAGSGNGWKNINSRAAFLKGEVMLDTRQGRQGSTFVLNIPIHFDDAPK